MINVKRNFKVGLIFLFIFLLVGCGVTKEKPDEGTIDGTKYTNNYFGFTLTTPEG